MKSAVLPPHMMLRHHHLQHSTAQHSGEGAGGAGGEWSWPGQAQAQGQLGVPLLLLLLLLLAELLHEILLLLQDPRQHFALGSFG